MSIFDGMAGLLNEVFGDPVTHRPAAGLPSVIRSVLREDPVNLAEEDGPAVIGTALVWKVPAPAAAAAEIADGDEIDGWAGGPFEGRTFRILNKVPAGSPAADRFILYMLEEVT